MDTLSAKKPFYITTTIPYVNADPHIGFAFELVQADMIARYKKSQGFEVFFNTGTDEHGIKIFRKASDLGQDPHKYVDQSSLKYKKLLPVLGISEDVHFVRTTDLKHKKAVQEFWRLCMKAGDIYKKNYKVKYCVGCELEKTDSELVNGRCPIHSSLPLEIIEEENYFFRFSKYEERLKKLYRDIPDFVIPDFRFNEIKAFVGRGLQDFSISRQKAKMPWGVAVPDDPEHVMYVWFDAFINYISTLGWPACAVGAAGRPDHRCGEDSSEKCTFTKWWIDAGGVLQFAGKDQIRQQAAMWQAMLMSAGIDVPSKQIVIHGFITSGGEKMSKSLGNVVDPFAIVKEYGTDALRYYLARHIHPFEDSDFTFAKFKEAYNANLANGLGNLVSRVMTMAKKNNVSLSERKEEFDSRYVEALEQFEINKAADFVWQKISAADAMIQKTEPFKKIKTDPDEAKKDIAELLVRLHNIAFHLKPILPKTSETIIDLVSNSAVPTTPLFPRQD